jgi:Mrp family chromosome partitioning ATPase/DUF971 family protein
MPTQDQVLDAMRHIIDPDLGRDIVSLGFIKNLVINGGAVNFTVELTTPACPVKEHFKKSCEQAVMALDGVESVEVTMSAMAPKQRPAAQTNTLEKVDTIIAVSSCKGGVGKSTVAAQLARAMQRDGLRVGLLDTDVYGPSAPTLFNSQHPHIAMRDNMLIPADIEGLKVMSLGFVMGEQPAVLRGPIVSGYTQQILQQTDWGELDYLIMDLPPGTGDIQLTIVQQAALDGAIIVTTPHSLSLVDVAKGILMFEKVHVPVLGVVENMSSFECDDCGKTHHPFGQSQRTLQDRFGLPTLAELPITNSIANVVGPDADDNDGLFKGMADQVHRAIGKSRADSVTPPKVIPMEGSISIDWGEGKTSMLSAYDVRCACPCARCVDEYTGAPLLDPSEVPSNIAVEAMAELGNYAVAFTWSDGHSTGIYSWDFLRKLAEEKAAQN